MSKMIFEKAWSVVKGSRAPDYHTINRPPKPVVSFPKTVRNSRLGTTGSGERGEGSRPITADSFDYADPNVYEDGKTISQLRSKTSMAKPLHLGRIMESANNSPYEYSEYLKPDARQHLIDEMEEDVIAGKPRYAMRMPRPEEEEETEQRRQELLADE